MVKGIQDHDTGTRARSKAFKALDTALAGDVVNYLFDHKESDMTKYWLGEGTVQPVLAKKGKGIICHFARAEYARELPVLSESIKAQAQPIVDKLNEKQITEKQAVKELQRIYL